MGELFPLRPLQQKALDMLRDSIKNGKRRIITQAPCGFGKTVLGAHMAAGALAKRNRVAFVVPMVSLVDQTVDRFIQNGIDPGDIGVIQADHPLRRPHAPLQVCSVQTIDRRGFPDVKFAIIDECHIQFKAISKWQQEHPEVMFFGLSATPWAKGMGDNWDDLLIPVTLAELIELGWLAKFRVFAAARKPDLSGVKTIAGDYHEGQLGEVMGNKTIVADVVSTWLEKGENRQTICFAVDRAHAAKLHDQFAQVGVGSAYVDGETPREERQKILGRYKRGEVKVINSIGTMTTGVDIPCQCLIMARPTKSEILFIQMFGRGLRNEEGKADMILLDHAGNCQRLGMPTSIGRTTLRSTAADAKEADNPEPMRKEPLPRECLSCNALVPAKTRTCPSCGADMKRSCDVETVEGELVEMGVDAPKKPRMRVIDRLREQGKQEIYSQLWGQGKGEKFVLAKYKAIFDVWPRGLSKIPKPSSADLESWLHSERIKWAKSRANIKNQGAASADDARGLADAR